MGKIGWTVGLAVLTAALLSSCAAGEEGRQKAEPDLILTYAENQASDYPTSQGAYRFAELVEERTEGRIVIDVQAGGVLGDERSIMEQMQFGGIDFARVSLSPLCEFVPELNVLQLPYLYRDADHMWKVLEGEIGDEFMAAMDGSNLVPLSWYDAGVRNFYTTDKQIRTLEDMRGMKIRTQESELMMAMVRALGADPTPMAYSEVYSALQTGMIDGAENNWPSYESTSDYKVARYFTIDEHNRVPELQLVAQSTWDKLSEEDQEIIRACALESALYERELWKKREDESRRIVEADGITIYELPEAEKERFREAVQPLYEEYCGEYMDIILKIVETE